MSSKSRSSTVKIDIAVWLAIHKITLINHREEILAGTIGFTSLGTATGGII
jgi:hypothetical protein